MRQELLLDVFQGTLLPSEPELMLRYSCSRNALREALDLLRQDGLVARVPGAGTFAILRPEIFQHDGLQGLAEQLPDGSSRVKVNVLEARLMPSPIPVAKRLEITPGEEVVFFERRLFLDGTPLSLWSSYLPAAIAGRILDMNLEQDFYHLIEVDLGLRLGRAEVAIDAIRPDHSGAVLLQCDPASPLLHLTRLARRDNNEPVELGFVHLRGERIQFLSNVQRTAPGGR